MQSNSLIVENNSLFLKNKMYAAYVLAIHKVGIYPQATQLSVE